MYMFEGDPILVAPHTAQDAPQPIHVTEHIHRESLREARELFGLPDSSPLTDPHLRQLEKDKILAAVMEQNERNMLDFDGTFLERGEKHQKKLKEYASKEKTYIDKLIVKGLAMRGIKNAQEVVDALDQAGAGISASNVIDNTVISNLKKIGSDRLMTSLHRITALGYSTTSSLLRSTPFADAAIQIASIPESDFWSIAKSIDAYSFLHTNYYPARLSTGTLEPDFELLMQVFTHGGFSPEQKKVLDQTKKRILVTGEIVIQGNASPYAIPPYSSDVNLATCLQPESKKYIGEEMLTVIEDAVYQKHKYDPAAEARMHGDKTITKKQLTMD